MSETIELAPAATDATVSLEWDGKTIAYHLAPITRSVGRELKDGDRRRSEVAAEADGELFTDDQDERFLRASCDQLNAALTTRARGAPKAGDMLFDAWAADEVTEEQIYRLRGRVLNVEDPTPA